MYNTLKKGKVTNIISAVKLFDDEFFSDGQYAIFFRSQSIQPSSFQYPRILLFGKDRKLRVGVNHLMGNKRNLEIIQYRSKSRVWELREIKFDNGKLSMTQPNPSLCLSCHGDKKIVPAFKGKVVQVNKYKMDYLIKGKKPDVSFFKNIVNKDPIYSRLKNLNGYLRDLEL